MKTNRVLLLCIVSLLTSTATADSYIWDGGGTDDNWSTADNWNPSGAPVSASDTTIELAGATRLTPVQDIADPFILNQLIYRHYAADPHTAFTLDGQQIQVAVNGTTQPRIYFSRQATCHLGNDIHIPAGITFTLKVDTYNLYMDGLISGDGGIVKTDNFGGLYLNHAYNTFAGGLTVQASNGDWRRIYVPKSGAMGTGTLTLDGGSISSSLDHPGGLMFLSTTTHTNKIVLIKNSPVFVGKPTDYNDNVTLNGNIDLNTYTLYLRGGGTGTINGVISEGASDAIIKLDAGTWTLGGENTFTGNLTINYGVIKLGTSVALDADVNVLFSEKGGILALNGNHQTIASLTGEEGTVLVNTLTSSDAATLTVNQSGNTVFDGKLSEAISLIKLGSGTLTLTERQSSTTGDIAVNNGTLAVASGAVLDSGDISVSNASLNVTSGAALDSSSGITVVDGSLNLSTPDAITDTTALYIGNGGEITLGGGTTETVDKLFINGIQQERGYYGATGSGAMFINDTFFSGTEMLFVESNPPITPVDTTWDAEGSDTFVSTPENWVDDAVPTDSGAANLIFATDGDTATIDSTMNLYKITFNRDNNFTLATGNGIITNGVGGISAQTPSTSAHTYTIEEDMVLYESQTWNVENGSASTLLVIDGKLDDGFLPCNITKEGTGDLKLTASNSFDGVFTGNGGDIDVTDSHAFGSTNGHTVINGYSGARLSVSNGVNIEEPLYLHGELNNAGTLISKGDGINTISGPVTCEDQVRIKAIDADLVFSGGITAVTSNHYFVINARQTITFTDKPLNLAGCTFWTDTGGLTVLAVTNNTWSDTMVAGGTLRCSYPDVLPPSSSLRVGVSFAPYGILDLNGNDQTIGKLDDLTHKTGSRRITSPTPALLTIAQDDNTSFNGQFHGELSVLKLGTGTLTLTNAFTSTAGSFIVSNGTLKASNLGTFGDNSTNVVVSGTGSIVLENDAAVSDNAELHIDESGYVEINAGLTEKVKYLFLDGEQKSKGTYGATGSGANNINDIYFSGEGMLEVLRDNSGTVILIL
ncbi:MAG: autotransporter-associated beta strand repeat-containing protein [Kiritimatiellia bacterium]